MALSDQDEMGTWRAAPPGRDAAPDVRHRGRILRPDTARTLRETCGMRHYSQSADDTRVAIGAIIVSCDRLLRAARRRHLSFSLSGLLPV
jgi:hypothetical protein